jgi:hypothetical protein
MNLHYGPVGDGCKHSPAINKLRTEDRDNKEIEGMAPQSMRERRKCYEVIFGSKMSRCVGKG